MPGSPRQDFGVRGRATLRFPGADEFRDAVLDSAGRVVLLGLHVTGGAPSAVAILARFDVASGALDATFGSAGIVTFSDGDDFDPAALVIDRSGRFVISGGGKAFRVARLDPSGRLDATFGSAGTIHFANDSVYKSLEAIQILPDERLIAAGTIFSASSTGFLVRLTPDGLPDMTFGTGGMLAVGGSLLSVQPDISGRLLALSVHHVLRRSPDGSPDLSFGASGETALSIDPKRILLRGGEIFVAGENTSSTFAAAKLTANGAVDPSFGVSGVAVFPGCASSSGGLAVDDATRILVSGYCLGSGPRDDLVRFRADGTIDGSFGLDGGIPEPCSHADAHPGRVLVTADQTILYAAACASNGEADLAVFGYNP